MSANAEKDVADFLSRVVPWPEPGTPGFINVHWTFPSHGGMGGKPFAELSDALSFIERAKNQPAVIKDLYFCLSLQAKTGLARNGEPTASRKRENAVALKAIWLDIDCNKEAPKGYRCKKDGLQHSYSFATLRAHRIQRRSSTREMVSTSTGFPTKRYHPKSGLLMPRDWMRWPYSTDYYTIPSPRMPRGSSASRGRPTTNKSRPKPVVIKLLEADLSFASALSHLLKANAEEHAPARPRKRAGRKDVEDIVVDPAVLEGGPAPIFKDLPPDEFKLNGYDFRPLPFKPIQEGCPFFADAYETHGKEHAQPLWHLTILATTFLEDGERLAHELGNAHPDYTPDTTQAMWDRKVREREERRPWLAGVPSVRERRMHVLQKLPAPRKNQVTVEPGCPGNP